MGWAQCVVRALTTLCDYRTCVQRNAVVQGEQVEDPLIMLGLLQVQCKVGNPPKSSVPPCGFILYAAIVLETISCGYFHWSLIMDEG